MSKFNITSMRANAPKNFAKKYIGTFFFNKSPSKQIILTVY